MGRVNKQTRRYWLATVVMVVALFMPFIGASDTVSAANVWSGRAERHGYFKNQEAGSESPYTCSAHYSSGPVIDNDCYDHPSIPTSVNTKGEMLRYLKNKYSGGSTWEKTGVAFIVNTMLGRQANNVGENKDRELDNSEWNELEQKLSNPNVTAKNEMVSSSSYGRIDTYYQYKKHDVAYYKDSESGNATVFRYKGKAVYVLLHKCANPLGDLDGLPDYNPDPDPDPDAVWKITPSTSVSVTGNTITWQHKIDNDGPNATDANVTYRYVNGDGLPAGTGPANVYVSGKGRDAPASFTSSFAFNPATDAGKTFCRATTATPKSGSNSGAITSEQACVTIDLNYQLHPVVSFNGGTAIQVESGQQSTDVSYGVRNDGPTASNPTAWQLTRCNYAPGVASPTISTETTNGTDPLLAFGGACNEVTSGSDAYDVTTKNYGPATENIGDQPVGTHVCFIMSVNPPSSGGGGWRHSAPACAVVLKFPKIQAWGGDIKAGLIRTRPASTVNGRTYGSWAEYGIFNYGSTSGMGSAAVFAGGCGANCMDITRLTFANTTGEAFATAPDSGYYDAYHDAGGTAFNGSLNGLTSGSYAYGGDLSIGGAVAAGSNAVISISGDLRITSDVTYPNVYTNASQVPRLIFVVDGDVKVDNAVSTVDAWIISRGTLYTCTEDSASTRARLTASICDNKLTFNGPVSVTDTRLSRTYGADASKRDESAEVFNLRPDAFIGSMNVSAGSGNIQTVYEKELPPRW